MRRKLASILLLFGLSGCFEKTYENNSASESDDYVIVEPLEAVDFEEFVTNKTVLIESAWTYYGQPPGSRNKRTYEAWYFSPDQIRYGHSSVGHGWSFNANDRSTICFENDISPPNCWVALRDQQGQIFIFDTVDLTPRRVLRVDDGNPFSMEKGYSARIDDLTLMVEIALLVPSQSLMARNAVPRMRQRFAPIFRGTPGPVKIAPRSQNVFQKTSATPIPGGRLIGSNDRLTSSERSYIMEMVKGGRTVEIIPSSAGRTPDFLMDGVRYELKTISNIADTSSDGISSAISSRVMDGRGQSSRIIVDGRSQRGLTSEIAERGIYRAYGADAKTGRRLESVTVVTREGTVHIPRRE